MHVLATDLTFAYGGSGEILRGVSFGILSGEAVAVIGPSGSGKSTLLHLVGGLSSPTRGEVKLDGTEANHFRHDVAWVFQTVNVVRKRTAMDNAAMGLYRHGAHWHDCLGPASDALARVGLLHCTNRRVEDLSGGELQRVVIARALVSRARLILADEPTGQLDAAATSRAVDALVTVRGPDTTLMIATHDSAVAARCDRVMRIELGRLVE